MKISVKSALDRMHAQSFPTITTLDNTQPPATPLWLREAQANPTTGARSSTRPPSLLSRRWFLGGATAAVAAAVIGTMVVPSLLGSSTAVATPALLTYTPVPGAPTASDALQDLARLAAAQPRPAGTGPYNYVSTHTWSLSTSMTTAGEVFDSRIAETQREQWLAEDGSGRIEAVQDGQRTPYSGSFAGVEPLSFLTTDDPAQLADTLLREHPDLGAGEWLFFVRTVWTTQTVEPDVQAALMQVLSRQTLELAGQVTDRAGRPGVAFSAQARIDDGPLAQYILIFDPGTGMLMDSERVALEKAGDIQVTIPATTEYIIWLGSGYTETVDDRP